MSSNVEVGDRMSVWCDGGPAIGRTVVSPLPSQLDVAGGIDVLVDDGEPSTWRYEFVPVTMPG